MILLRIDRETGQITEHSMASDICRWLAKYICSVPEEIRAALERGETVTTNYAKWHLKKEAESA